MSSQTFSLRPGALSLQFHCLFTDYCLALNWPPEMWQKCIARSRLTIPNGPPQWFTLVMMLSPLILPYASGQVHQLGCTGQFRMQQLTSCDPKALGPYLVGLMTTCLFAFKKSFFPGTISGKKSGALTSGQEVSIKREEGFGSGVGDWRMACLRNGMKTAPSRVGTYLGVQPNPKEMRNIHTILTILTPCHGNSAFLGRYPRTSPSPAVQLILVSTGTSRQGKSCWEQPRKTSTCEPQKTGLPSQHTCSRRGRPSMAHFFICAWSHPWDGHILWSLRRCWGSSIAVHAYHAPDQKAFEWTCTGGSMSSNSQPSLGQSLTLFPSMKPKLFQM